MIFIDVIRKGTKKVVGSGYVDDGERPRAVAKRLAKMFNPKKHRFQQVRR